MKPIRSRARSAPELDIHLASLIGGLPGMLYRCRNDADYTADFVSDGVSRLTGYAADEFRQHRRHFGSLIHPADRERVWSEGQAAVAARQPFELTYRIVTAAGATQWVWEKGRGIHDAHGDLVALEGFITDIDQRKQAEEALRDREQRLRAIIETEPECVKVVSREGALLEMNAAGLDMLQAKSLAEVQRAGLPGFIAPEHRAPFAALHERVMAGESGTLEFEVRGLRGARRWLETHAAPLRGMDGKVEMLLGITRDVTERRESDEKIRRLTRVYAVLSGISGALVRMHGREALFGEACRIAVDEGRFRMAWLGLVDATGERVKPGAWAGEVRGFLDAAPLSIAEDAPGGHGLAGRAIRERRPVISNDIEHETQRIMKRECLERGINSLAVLPLLVGGRGVGVLALYAEEKNFFDDREMRLLEELAGNISFALEHIGQAEQLEFLSNYDPLTGLANSALFQEQVGKKIVQARGGEQPLALFIADVERFKTINDTLGRPAGDELIRQIAARIAEAAGPAACVARVGADHFAVLVPGLGAESEVLRFAEEGRQRCFDTPFRVGDAELRVSVKLGVAVYPRDARNAATLFRNAEAALKQAKAGGEPYLFYTRQMTERVAENLALENKLRLALEKDEFVLHYQPKVDLQSGGIVGVEALIRWQSPKLGLVPPLKFIPLLEETGLILGVGSWALERAARDHRGWVEAGLAAPRIAVNVSAIQLRQKNFVDMVKRALLKGVAPVGIDLEITESLIMEDVESSIAKLNEARGLGLKVAIDDFGTGYSSLAYLARLPLHALKIDRSFIIKMLAEPATMTLVQTIVTLAHSLRLAVVAEGVDKEEQAKVLRLIRCDQMQGYLFSKPLPLAEMTALLQKTSARQGALAA